MKIDQSLRRKWRKAFSLVELMIVIAVIGVIAAMAIPSLSNVNKNSRVVAAKSKAQRMASTFNAGQSAGASGFLAASSLDSALDALGTGSNGGGAMASSFFQLAGTSAALDSSAPTDEQARHYLSWDSGVLIYSENGAAPEYVWIRWGMFESAEAAQSEAADGNSTSNYYVFEARGLEVWARPK